MMGASGGRHWLDVLGASNSGDGPLADVLVAELGTGVAVAFCGKLLADFGATVVKVEHPSKPDPVRRIAPFLPAGPDAEVSAFGHFLNGRKLSVALDYDTEGGASLLRRLLAEVDIVTRFVDGSAPIASGVDTPAGPVRVELSWFGQTGPWSGFAGNDFLAQHVSGMAFATAVRVPDPATQPPLATAGHLAEMVAGLTAATAAIVALLGRDADGSAEVVDISVAEAITSFMRQEIVLFSYGAGLMSRSHLARSPIAAPVYQQPTADGYVDMMILQEAPWEALIDILGNPEWAKNPLFANHPLRSLYWDAVEPLLQQELGHFTSDELFREGQTRGIAIAPINDVARAAAAPQFNERAYFESEQYGETAIRLPGAPARVGGTPAPRRLHAAPGADNAKVFGEWLGCSPDELAAITASRVR